MVRMHENTETPLTYPTKLCFPGNFFTVTFTMIYIIKRMHWSEFGKYFKIGLFLGEILNQFNFSNRDSTNNHSSFLFLFIFFPLRNNNKKHYRKQYRTKYFWINVA